MTLFENLKTRSINARKAKLEEATVLNTLLSEVRMRAKNDGNREPVDEDVVKTIQAFIKSAENNLTLLEKNNRDTSSTVFEINTLQSLLPTVMDESLTTMAVESVIFEIESPSIKDMGRVMTALKEAHGVSIDMKLASKIYKELVS